MEKSTVGTYDFIRCKWWIGFWVFFFRKMKKSHFLPIVPSVGMTWVKISWSRTGWQQELQLHNTFLVNCFVHLFSMLLFEPLSHFCARPKGPCGQTISICLFWWFPTGREMRRGSSGDLLTSPNPDHPNHQGGKHTFFYKSAFPTEEAEALCVEGGHQQVRSLLKPSIWLQPLRDPAACCCPSVLRWRQEERMGTCFHQLQQEPFCVESKGNIFFLSQV